MLAPARGDRPGARRQLRSGDLALEPLDRAPAHLAPANRKRARASDELHAPEGWAAKESRGRGGGARLSTCARLAPALAVLFSLIACAAAHPLGARNLTKRGPSYNWNAGLEGWLDVPNNAGIEDYHVFPDSHISAVQSVSGDWIVFWSNCQNWRSRGPTPMLEAQNRVEPNRWFYGGRTGAPGVANGGRWLMSVHRHPTDGNRRHFVAFTHMEDGFWPYQGAGGPAWGSIGLSHSYDEGLTWEDRGVILTSRERRPPDDQPRHGGIGNHVANWDSANRRWIMVFSERFLGVAVSYDPDGAPGSWRKWIGWNRGFLSPGMGGRFLPLPNLASVPGGNPSLHWNTVLQRWVLVWHGWDLKLYVSASDDCLSWDAPRLLTTSVDGSRAWYPTVISWEGNDVAGGESYLYYADKFVPPDRRSVIKRTLRISRND
ncbi:hypothetical protein DFJ74DRAFT_773874 [Hyaloraphidium curvatum]|nr:hypothetical protein DFJ74DRAFT_773874 [Hyaloraphidium curvatum]